MERAAGSDSEPSVAGDQHSHPVAEENTEDSAEDSVEYAGEGDGVHACDAELLKQAEYQCHAVDKCAGGILRHELPVHGMAESCESTPEGRGKEVSAHEAHSDPRGIHCLPVDDTDANEDQARPAVAMPKQQRTTEYLHHARPCQQVGVEVGSIQGAVCHGDTLWGEGLLGCSGHVSAAVQRALREVEELHQSDALMHYEVCWPHPDLTEVCASRH